MLKVRVVLGLMIFGFMISGMFLWESGLETITKVLFTVLGSFLYLAACLMMATTFFALNQEGHIPRGSLTYRYLSRFYHDDPDHLRICSAFWVAAAGIFFAFLGCVLCLLLAWAVGYGVLVGYATETLVGIGKFLGAMVGVVVWIVAVSGVFALIVGTLIDKVKSPLLQSAVFICLCYGFFFFLISPVVFLVQYDQWSVWYERFFDAIQIGATISLVVVMAIGTLLGIMYLASFILPWMRHSLVGRMFIGFYYNVCPMIPVEPRRKP